MERNSPKFGVRQIRDPLPLVQRSGVPLITPPYESLHNCTKTCKMSAFGRKKGRKPCGKKKKNFLKCCRRLQTTSSHTSKHVYSSILPPPAEKRAEESYIFSHLNGLDFFYDGFG